MLVLVIDTATERAVIGLVNILEMECNVLTFKELEFGWQSSVTLLPALEQCLVEQNVSFDDIAFIVAGVGPGSYTGMRVTAVVAKTLSYARKIPLVAVGSMYGWKIDRPGPFAVLFDARISGVYLLLRENKGDEGFVTIEEVSVCSLKNLKAKLGKCRTLLVPSKGRLPEMLSPLFLEESLEWIEMSPDPAGFALEGLRLYNEGLFSLDGSLELQYLRKAQAEQEREKNNSHL